VTSSPQFHENHVLLGPLAFNLLIGRRWPPGPQDLQDAYELCVALGLGALLDRMPAGLQQMVGDTGWQLSHGERSLVFLARALLQRPDVVLLDETFGSFDPVTLQRALGVAVERAGTLLVIRQ
jgi:ATP-binding cassette subfamily B protein